MGVLLTQKIDGEDREYEAVNEDAATALEASGWKRKPTTKAAAAKTEEK